MKQPERERERKWPIHAESVESGRRSTSGGSKRFLKELVEYKSNNF